MSRVVCASHGHCFDGLASAMLLSELVETEKPRSQFQYYACSYGPRAKTPNFDGDDNALLDYRYVEDERLNYYFDHHATAFSNDETKSVFDKRAREPGNVYVFDPDSKSCTELIYYLARDRFGLSWSKHQDIINWARVVDGALFDTVEEATDREDLRMRLVNVVSHFGDHDFYARAIPILRQEGLTSLTEQKFVKEFYRTLAPSFRAYNQRVKKNGRQEGRVAVIDLSDATTHVVTKFEQYRRFPTSTYSVVTTVTADTLRISVGYNPWSGHSCDHHIGELCATYGGGGHRVVGGIAIARSGPSQAQTIAQEITQALQTPVSSPQP